jgi:SAM-dependent methyltransferase
MATYSKKFFSTIKDGSLSSAREILPYVFSLVPHDSIVDVGCGTGTWLLAAKESGAKTIHGMDGGYVPESTLVIDKSEFKVTDLRRPFTSEHAPFDLAFCMEVAEHLPDSSAAPFVKSLTSLAPVVLFSAAIPWQGGTGHVNEQWPAYWSSLFKLHHYQCIDILRPQFWNNENVEPWYAQNAFLFVHQPGLTLQAFARDEPLSLVHPKILDIARKNAQASSSIHVQIARSARRSLKRLLG